MNEIWKPIKNYEGCYEVSNYGKIRSIKRKFAGERILKPSFTKGYLQVSLSSKNIIRGKTVHRIVAETFIKNPQNKYGVNHKNSDKTDNNILNLEWATPFENIQHAKKNGLLKGLKGELNPWSKLTENEVIMILSLKNMYSQTEIAKKFGMSHQAISDIFNKRRWKHIQTPPQPVR